MERGKVKWFDKTKGFGFISREGAEDLFVHYKAIADDKKRLRRGDIVEFEIEEGPKGIQAAQVRVLESRHPGSGAESSQSMSEMTSGDSPGAVPPTDRP